MKTLNVGRRTMLVDDDFEAPGVICVDSGGYAQARIYVGYDRARRRSIRRRISVHRFVAQAPPGLQVDHINGNRLDNRRENLRLCTAAQNARNRRQAAGVTWHKQIGKWQAGLKINGRFKYLGVFASRDDAIAARRAAERVYFGEFAPQRSA